MTAAVFHLLQILYKMKPRKILTFETACILFTISLTVYMCFCVKNKCGVPTPYWNSHYYLTLMPFFAYLLYDKRKRLLEKYSKRIITIPLVYAISLIILFILASFIPAFRGSVYHTFLNSKLVGIILTSIILFMFLRNAWRENKKVLNKIKSKRNE